MGLVKKRLCRSHQLDQVVKHHVAEFLFVAEDPEDLFLNGVRADQIDVGAFVLLTDAMDSVLRLQSRLQLVVAGVVDERGGLGERKALRASGGGDEEPCLS